jgi:uncharacterized protein YydD (DUF2326 family)
MAREFKERFLGRDNQEHYGNEIERIFGKKKEEKMSDGKYTNEMARQDTVEVCSSVYNDKIKQLEERLKDAEEVVAFYGELDNYTETSEDEFEGIRSDYEKIDNDEFIGLFAGKRARAYQAKYQVKEIVK